jgi:hypothetical protein
MFEQKNGICAQSICFEVVAFREYTVRENGFVFPAPIALGNPAAFWFTERSSTFIILQIARRFYFVAAFTKFWSKMALGIVGMVFLWCFICLFLVTMLAPMTIVATLQQGTLPY